MPTATSIPELSHLSDKELVNKLLSFRGRENEVISDIVLHLAELDKRQSYRDLGYSSLFTYCTKALGYSEGAACRRISAARCLKNSPEVFGDLRSGKVSLCALVEVAKVRDEKGKEKLINLVQGKSRREAERLVAEQIPEQISKRERITIKRAFSGHSAADLFNFHSPPPAAVTRYSLNFEADAQFMELYEKAKAFSGAYTLLEVMRKALGHYVKAKLPVERQKRRKISVSSNKTIPLRQGFGGQAATTKVTRHVPLKVRDDVFLRDGGRCCFKSSDGTRCSEINNLQIDHIRPWAINGSHDPENLRLLCPAHNRLMAERVFGKEKIQSYCPSGK